MDSDWIEVDSFPTKQEPKNEGVPDWIGRQLSRTGARALETTAGTPRSSYDLLQAASSYIPESVKGALTQGLSAIHPAASWVPSLVGAVGSQLPSSQNVRETLAQLAPEGYLEPQTEGEEVADAITSATTNLLFGKIGIPNLPTTGKAALDLIASSVKGLGKAATAASAGQIGSFLSKKLGAGPLGQELTNVGMTLITSAGLGSNLNKAAADAYAIRDNAIRSGESIKGSNVSNITKRVTNNFLNNSISTKRPGYEQVNDIVNALDNAVNTNQFGDKLAPLKGLVSIKEQMGDYISSLPKGSDKAKKVIIGINEELKAMLKNPSITGNKIFSEAQTAADGLYTHIKSSQNINNWVRDVLTSQTVLGAGSLASMYGLATNPAGMIGKAATAGAVAGVGYGVAKSGNLIRNIATIPSVRKEYTKMIMMASKENTAGFIKSAKKLNNILSKNESDESDWVEI